MIDDDSYLPESYCRNWETKEKAGRGCSLQYDVANRKTRRQDDSSQL
jgi:hypothetical protein